MRFIPKSLLALTAIISITTLFSCDDSLPGNAPNPNNPKGSEFDKYATHEINLKDATPVPNNDGNKYISFADGKVFMLTAEEAQKSTKWDIAFSFVDGFVNAPSKGSGEVKVALSDYTKFDDVVNYQPFTSPEVKWVGNQEGVSVLDFSSMPPQQKQGEYNPYLVNYYKFGAGHPPKAIMDEKVRIVKTLSGEYVKLQFIQVYEDPEAPSGFGKTSLRYSYLKAEGENAPKEGEVRLQNVESGKLLQAIGKKLEAEKVKSLSIQGTTLTDADVDSIRKLPMLEELDLSKATLNLTGHFLKDHKTIKKVILPENLTAIGFRWLQYCTNLETVIATGDKLVRVGGSAFTLSTKLSTVVLSESVEEIGSEAFSYTALKSFTFPKKVTYVDGATFKGAKALEEVFLPAGITEIRGAAFESCRELKKLHFAGKTPFTWNENYRTFYGPQKRFPISGVHATFKIYIPKGTTQTFIDTWSTPNDQWHAEEFVEE